MIAEEMRRVLATLDFERAQWERRADGGDGETADVRLGRRAYALAQAAARARMSDAFRALWLRTEAPRGKVWDDGDTARLERVRSVIG